TPDLGVPPSCPSDAPRPTDARRADLSSTWRSGDPGRAGCADGTRHPARPSTPPAPRVLGAAAHASSSLAAGTTHRRRGQPLHSYAPCCHRLDQRASWPYALGLPATPCIVAQPDRTLVQPPRTSMSQAGQHQDLRSDGSSNHPLWASVGSQRSTFSVDLQRLSSPAISG